MLISVTNNNTKYTRLRALSREFMQEYVHRLKKIIDGRKIKLTELSKATEIPYRTLQDNFSKNKDFPVHNLVKIATYLRISLDELLLGREGYKVCEPATPYTTEVLKMMEGENEETQKEISRCVEEKKLLMMLLREKQGKK